MAKPVRRPMSFLDIIDEAFHLYKTHFLLLTGITALAFIPFYVAAYAIGGTCPKLLWYMMFPLSSIVSATETWAISQYYLGKPATIWGSYRRALVLAIPVIITNLLVYIAVTAGIFLLVIPGVLIIIAYCLVQPVLVIEESFYWKACVRCWNLVNGYRMRMLGLLILYLAFVIIINTILSKTELLIGLRPAGKVINGGLQDALFGLRIAIKTTLCAPLGSVIFTLVYYDIRVRKEGLDVKLLMEKST